jgi:hypothetical protein
MLLDAARCQMLLDVRCCSIFDAIEHFDGKDACSDRDKRDKRVMTPPIALGSNRTADSTLSFRLMFHFRSF